MKTADDSNVHTWLFSQMKFFLPLFAKKNKKMRKAEKETLEATRASHVLLKQ
jgi:membrane-anchored glycerophosphoryl diester phosphodiesterase (GDPDase)